MSVNGFNVGGIVKRYDFEFLDNVAGVYNIQDAYDYAVRLGYTGTRKSWVESLSLDNPNVVWSKDEMVSNSIPYVYKGWIYFRTSETIVRPTFVNVLERDTTTTVENKRWSSSSGLVDAAHTRSIIMAISPTATTIQIRVRGASLSIYNHAYGGSTNASFDVDFGTHDTTATDANGDYTFTITNNGCSYMIFMIDTATLADEIIVTENKPIAYSSNTEIVYNNTGLPFANAETETKLQNIDSIIDSMPLENQTVETADFVNLLDRASAYTRLGYRYSGSSNTFVEAENTTAVIVPVPETVTNLRIRVRGTNLSTWNHAYGGTTSATFPTSYGEHVTDQTDSNGDWYFDITNTGSKFIVFMVSTPLNSGMVVTCNEAITYSEETVPVFAPDGSGSGGGFAYSDVHAPVPQLAANGGSGDDFNAETADADDIYDYIDALLPRYKNLLTKITMGRDYSDTYDCNTYVVCKAYYHAWCRRNYPKMFAWANGSSTIYSTSVSPRVGETMYSTPYVGSSAGTVSTVGFSQSGAAPSTRTVNGTVYTRAASSDVAPTLVYTIVADDDVGDNILAPNFNVISTISAKSGNTITNADSVEYDRYPFADLFEDGSKPIRYFILANEHGGNSYGDPREGSIVVARMIKDICENKNNDFLLYLKNNCCLTIVPVGNPWGFSRNDEAGYQTAHHVNINRNYDVPGWYLGPYNAGQLGDYPCSEPETQYIEDSIQFSEAVAGMSIHTLGFTDAADTNCHYQGNGFDDTKMPKIAKTMGSDYNLVLSSYGTNASQDPYHCGKSPAYIQYAGLVGGIIELQAKDAQTNTIHTSTVLEQCYTQVLQFISTWIAETREN